LKGDELAERLLDFAVRVGKVVNALPNTRLGRHVAGQLVRCGTSPSPNYEEGRAAESRADFVHKLGVCHKELRETGCWLQLIVKADMLPKTRLTPLCDECDQLCRIIGRSILTAKKNGGAAMKNEKRKRGNGNWTTRSSDGEA
jgi:four helix bundle protein